MNVRLLTAIAFMAAVLGAMASFILTTVAMDSLPDAVLVGGSLLVALVLIALSGGWKALRGVRNIDRRTLALAVGGGALTFWAAPLLALSQRASDAPSGADTLFLTTTLWGVLVVLGAYLVVDERPALTGIAGAVCSAAGAAGMLASWEYPSSFSPFAKFPVREALMLLAGLLFAAGILALAAAARRASARDALVLGMSAAAVLGMLVSLPGLPTAVSSGISTWWWPCVYLGIATGLFAIGWVWAVSHVGVVRTSTSLFLVPPAMTALAAYERATAAYGPNPFEPRGVTAGLAIASIGAAVVWFSASDRRAAREVHTPAIRVAVWTAVASCTLAVLSLGTPALGALSEGHITESFRVAWTMLGFESAAGWMPVAAGLLALTAALEARRGGAARTWLVASAAVLACALAMPLLSATTLHTWNRWIPADVQQTYGTEYARLSVTAIVDPVRVAAMALAVISAGVLGMSVALGKHTAASQEEG